jgi:tungstate transport system permease protein
MNTVALALSEAAALIGRGDSELTRIVLLSLKVSTASIVAATAIAMPLGAWLAVVAFPGQRAIVVLLNALLGLPSVVVGLVVYLLLSRAGPLGAAGILFTPAAMVVAQAILVTPLVGALTRQAVSDAWQETHEQLRSLGAGPLASALPLLWDLRFSLVTVVLAGFGRAVSEVGAVMIVGGNIDGVTRVMTTAIALETSKGDLPLALGLGFVLLAIVLAVNALAHVIREAVQRRHA